ncbi:MAG: dihydrolipoyllysine-residue acetyltransferase [Nevskia sp.]|nr:dihydrolipoyllysine-residue acetyltransferase [Nevskia sp.]
MAKELVVTVPDIGDFADVPVIDVLVKPGDSVQKEAPLVTLESEKATMDVPAPEAGTVKSLRLKVGDKVSKGDGVLVLEIAGDEAASPAPAAVAPVQAAAPPPATPSAPAPATAAPAAPAAAAAAPARIEVVVPDIGDFHDVPVIEVFVREGQAVDKDAPLVTLESEKAAMDVPAPEAGVVRALRLKLGDKVSQGTPICTLETTGSAAAVPAAAAAETASAPAAAPAAAASAMPVAAAVAPAQPPAEPSRPAAGTPIPYASPAVRKFARELGADLALVKGSGPRGRITRDDIQSFVKQALKTPAPAAPPSAGGAIPPIPAVDFAQFGAIQVKPLARIRKLSAAHLHRSWLNVPHVTQDDEADVTELEAFRKTQGEELAREGGAKLTLLPFLLKAVARATDAYPEFRSSLAPDGENLIMKQYTHIGFAADTANGLVVPVVRDVDRKGIVQLAQETAELAKKARDGKLKAEDMRGGCFTISSLGGIGGGHFTPIVNAPEVAILGVSRAVMKPVWDGTAFQPRLMLPLSLSYDHRVIDGAYAARFIVQLVKLLADLRRVLL